jgi:phospho-N-acetylmuramoyl-pentapeptide-transferase
MILALLAAFALLLVLVPRVLPLLRKLNFGQTIYELGPESHKTKQGTPIMGGLIIAFATVAAALALHQGQWNGIWDFTLSACALAVGSMLIGFADDYTKAVKKRSMGLTGWQKIAGQVVLAAGFSVYCYFHPQVGSRIWVPFFNVEWDLGLYYIPLMTLVVIFMVNSANLQDGMDGLLSTVTVIGSAAWGLIAVFLLPAALDAYGGSLYNIGIFALALTGACMGFLRFNRYPAMVFMGDTGSMFIGGATVAMAMLLRQPLMLLLIAFTMVMSSVSVILQRIYFKLTHGKRIFKMSPIHHHFELSGYSETQVVALYAIITGILSLVALLSMNVTGI